MFKVTIVNENAIIIGEARKENEAILKLANKHAMTTFTPPPIPFPPEEYNRRIERLRTALDKAGLDGAIITRDISRLYFTGLDSSAGTLAISVEEGAVFAVDFRYILIARKALPFAKCILQKAGKEPAITAMASKWKAAGYESLDSKARADRLAASLPGIRKWSQIDDAISEMRSVKSPREINVLREAIARNDALYAHVLPQLHPGMTEWDARNIIRAAADRFGHGESFDTIVCAGRNAAECHHRPDLTTIRHNSSLLMDFGLVYNHYHSDMTRCVATGQPSRLYTEIFGIVLDANRRAIETIRPGITGADVDAVARRHIADAGYGEAFAHSLGHSVGLEIHEGPNFSQTEKRILKPGMVITVEPGIYLPGRAGVRIEDVVLVTRTGCETLTKSQRELMSI